jgi:hypothetical protein
VGEVAPFRQQGEAASPRPDRESDGEPTERIETMTLSNAAIEEKFQKIAATLGVDLSTDEEREQAAKDEASAQKQLEKEQAKA